MLGKLKIDFANATADDVIDCMRNAGYIIANNDPDFKLMCDGYFKYEGYRGNMHIYNAAFVSEARRAGVLSQDEPGYFMCDILVTMGKEGRLVAEYSARGPYMQDMDGDQMDNIFNIKS